MSAALPPTPLADVGLLFVHGIGSQRRGTQVVPFATALARFMSHEDLRAGRHARRIVATVTDAVLVSPDPAHARMSIARDATETAPATWLIAESVWSDSFIPPTFWQTILWLISKAPLLLTTRALEGMQRAWARTRIHPLSAWKLLVSLGWILVVMPVGILAILLVAALAAVRGFLPLAWMKNAVAKIELVVTDLIGDSYLYTEGTISQVAMESAVARDIAWLRERVRKVVVVAHSQGASVAIGALERSETRVDALVTLGAGISQLAWLRRVQTVAHLVVSLCWLAGLALLSVSVWIWVLPAITGEQGPLVFFFAFGGLTVLPSAVAFIVRLGVSFTRVNDAPGTLRHSPAESWDDLYASSDPVPGGDSTTLEWDGVSSVEVWNRGDLLRDHSGYLNNGSEVIPLIVRRALELSPKAIAMTTPALLAAVTPVVSGLRARRGRWIERLRVVCVVALIALALRYPAWTLDAGKRVMHILRDLGFVPAATIPYTEVPTALVIGIGILALLVFGIYLLGIGVVRVWAEMESTASIRRSLVAKQTAFGSAAGFILGVSYVLAVMVATVLVFIAAPALVNWLVAGALACGVVVVIAARRATPLRSLRWSRDAEERLLVQSTQSYLVSVGAVLFIIGQVFAAVFFTALLGDQNVTYAGLVGFAEVGGPIAILLLGAEEVRPVRLLLAFVAVSLVLSIVFFVRIANLWPG